MATKKDIITMSPYLMRLLCYQILDTPAVREADSDIETFTWGVRSSVDYKIQKWLFAELSCWYEDRDSSSDESEDLGRKKNVITFTIGAAF